MSEQDPLAAGTLLNNVPAAAVLATPTQVGVPEFHDASNFPPSLSGLMQQG